MIFTSVKNIKSKTELSFFKEQINVYVRLLEVYCEKKSISMNVNDETDITEELIKIGVISSLDEINELKTTLGTEYDRFIHAVRYAVENEDAAKVVKKLSNYERKKMQKEAG